VNIPVPKKLVDTMAERARRMHYSLWVEVRDNWITYPKDLQNELRKAGWEPPRPANVPHKPLESDDAGEDYLFMHRETIKYANKILTAAGDPNYRRIEGWLELPPPNDADYPVPPPWFDPAEFPVIVRFIERSKADIVYEKYLKPWAEMFSEPGFLKQISLGTLGSMIQSTVHDTVKRRWSAVPGGRRPELGPTVETIPTQWDDPRYNYLADFYSMQVNPVFWKFYGWVDDRVEEWKLVHGVFGTDFWKGKWIGKLPDAAEGAPSGLHERLEDPEVAKKHAAEIEQLLVKIGRSLAAAEATAA